MTCPVLEESKGTARLQGTSVCDTCWEQDLTLAPESERGDDRTPGLGAFMRAPGEGRSFPPGHPYHQPHQEATLEEQQAVRRLCDGRSGRRGALMLRRSGIGGEPRPTFLWSLSNLGYRAGFKRRQACRWCETGRLTPGDSTWALSLFH